MINPLALFSGVSLHTEAENAAFDHDWPRAADLVSQAIAAYGRVGRQKFIPLKVLTLSAMIDYRLGRFDAVSSTVATVLNADRRLWKAVRTPDANYIRYYLAELLEHVAGADAPAKSAEHLAQAEAIGVPRDSLEIAKADHHLVSLFPLVVLGSAE